jgi:N-acetylglucosaminyl-diphospho-decaprenol L-rhamnosyltransferase
MARVAIVVVTHNSAAEIRGCLDALAAADSVSEIDTIVVDNASDDGTVEKIAARGVRLIVNANNAGFAAAVNQGVRATDAPLILLLNPDAYLEHGLDALAAHFEDPGTGAAGGLLTDADGSPQTGFMARNLPSPAALIFEVLGINRLWPRNPVNWHYRCLGKDPVIPGLVEQPAGAFLMFSRKVWERLGGFDERFWPIWFEDVDFCTRLKQAGLNVYYNPIARARHTGTHSIRSLPVEIRERYWYGSLLKYAAKHYHSIAYRAVCFAVVSGAAMRAVRGIPRNGLKAFAVYGAVCRLATGRFFRSRRD